MVRRLVNDELERIWNEVDVVYTGIFLECLRDLKIPDISSRNSNRVARYRYVNLLDVEMVNGKFGRMWKDVAVA
jgi:hypothetical protein